MDTLMKYSKNLNYSSSGWIFTANSRGVHCLVVRQVEEWVECLLELILVRRWKNWGIYNIIKILDIYTLGVQKKPPTVLAFYIKVLGTQALNNYNVTE